MTRVDDAPLHRMVTAIVEEADPDQVILFGSHAKGSAAEESDVDLVVIDAAPSGGSRDRCGEAVRLWRALAHIRVPKDILVYSRDAVEYWRHSLNRVLARALREGKVFYQRPWTGAGSCDGGQEGYFCSTP